MKPSSAWVLVVLVTRASQIAIAARPATCAETFEALLRARLLPLRRSSRERTSAPLRNTNRVRSFPIPGATCQSSPRDRLSRHRQQARLLWPGEVRIELDHGCG